MRTFTIIPTNFHPLTFNLAKSRDNHLCSYFHGQLMNGPQCNSSVRCFCFGSRNMDLHNLEQQQDIRSLLSISGSKINLQAVGEEGWWGRFTQ